MSLWQKKGTVGALCGLAALGVALAYFGCGGTGSGGAGHPGGSSERQFVLNTNDFGRLTLNVSSATVDANKTDRIGLFAQLTDARGLPVSGVTITFTSDVPDISFIPQLPSPTPAPGQPPGNIGFATTGPDGIADIIAVAGSTPTASGDIQGVARLFASAPSPYSLGAIVTVTLTDVGFIDSKGGLQVIPAEIMLTEPAIGQVLFFNIVGGTPPYLLKNETSGLGFATLSRHCMPGCTENSPVLCVGSPCETDSDCNAGGSPTPSGVCLGPIKRCIATCTGPNCAGSRCATDADCNSGSDTPAGVCADAGQAIAYTIVGDVTTGDVAEGEHVFQVEDSVGASVAVKVTSDFVCGNGAARGGEVCDLGDLRGFDCVAVGFPLGGDLRCTEDCTTFDTSSCITETPSPTPTP